MWLGSWSAELIQDEVMPVPDQLPLVCRLAAVPTRALKRALATLLVERPWRVGALVRGERAVAS